MQSHVSDSLWPFRVDDHGLLLLSVSSNNSLWYIHSNVFVYISSDKQLLELEYTTHCDGQALAGC